ncbi:MAG: HAD-IA family hydrolase [archaeon]
MKKIIIFDFDGTIANTFLVVEEYGIELSKKYSIEINPKEARNIGLKKLLFKTKISKFKIPKHIKEVKKRIKSRIKKDIKIYRGMKGVLTKLSKKYHLGIISSNSESNIRKFLMKYNMLNLFDFIYSDTSLFGKHNILKRLCKKQKFALNEVVYIGDEDRDIRAAKKLGIEIIAVSWGFNSKNLLKKEKPSFLVNSPHEILKIFEQKLYK